MKTISVTEAKNNLSRLLRAVRAGSTIIITDRGIPVARLSPAEAHEGIPTGMLDLAERGVATLPTDPPSPHWLDLPWPRATGGVSAVDALLAEREAGR